MTIANQSDAEDVLKAASTPKAEAVELHQTTMTADGVMQMRQIKDGLAIEAGKVLALKPGGAHLMLLGLKEGLAAGDTLPLTLEFAKAGAVEVTLTIGSESPETQGHDGHAHH
jgi:copper(I)-binding protein